MEAIIAIAQAVGQFVLDELLLDTTLSVTAAVYTAAAVTLATEAALAYGLYSIGSAAVGQANADEARTVVTQTDPPQRVLLGGAARVAGARALYAGVPGFDLDVYLLNAGRVQGFERHWLHDDEVMIDGGTGYVTLVTPSDDRYSQGAVRIYNRLGLETETAYAEVIAATSLWTSDHRGDGQASAAVMLQAVSQDDVLKFFPNGPPIYNTLERGLFYDWRDPAQDRADPDTWSASANPIVCAINAELAYWGADWTRNVAPVLDLLTAEADTCDEAVPLAAGGTEPRYTLNGTFSVPDNDRADVRNWILQCMDGKRYVRPDGAILYLAGRYRTPVFKLKRRNIVQMAVKRGIPTEQARNMLTGNFLSLAHAWTKQPADPWRNDGDIADRGVIKAEGFDRELVASHGQWRRLAKAAMARMNCQLTLSLIADLTGLGYDGEPWIIVEGNPAGPPSVREDMIVEVQTSKDMWPNRTAFEVCLLDGPAMYSWDAATEEGAPPTPPGSLPALPAYQPVIDAVDQIGEPGSPQFQITIFDPALPSALYRIRYRPDGGTDGEWITETWRSAVAGSPGELLLQTGRVPFSDDVNLEVQANNGGVTSLWSASWTASVVTPPDRPTWTSLTAGGTGAATAVWANPVSANFHGTRVWVGASGSPFGSATNIGGLHVAGPATADSYGASGLSAGVHDFWLTAEDAGAHRSGPAGPQSVTIT